MFMIIDLKNTNVFASSPLKASDWKKLFEYFIANEKGGSTEYSTKFYIMFTSQ